MTIDTYLWRSARLFPTFPAVVDARRTLSYAEFADEVRRLAAVLQSSGLQAGDRVAVLAKNRWEYAALYYAAARVDAVVVPLNWRLSVPELRWILTDAAPTMVVAEAGYARNLDPVRHEIPGVRHWVALDQAPAGWDQLDQLMSASTLLADALQARAPEAVHAPLVQIYTSGTTGRPKGAVLTHANLAASIAALLSDFDLRPGEDRFLQVTPLFHVGGALMVMTCAATCTTLRLLTEFEPMPAARCLAQEPVTHTLMVPAMLRWLFAEPGVDQLKFDHLRFVAYGAAPMPVALLEQAMARLQCRFFQGYGLSETAGLLTILRPEDHVLDGSPRALARLASAGREMLGTHIRVVDPNGQDVPVGAVGEVVARGPCVSPGYWNLPEASVEANRGGWFWTGDLGTLDDERYLTIVDRVKDMIVLGGENIYPREIELALASHSAVTDCAVIGIPHELWGEEVLAYVTLAEGAAFEPRVLIAHCRQSLARYKCPTKVELLTAIPRNAAGKIEKAKLREPYWAGQKKRV